ncbi:MAG: hypothetical protein IMX06_01870 [Kyrpidia tusciae]|nr:hypothetical protein [Kyrpidia tusciae]MBE3551594.1 hypothetical protein [Kyrpidia tusciae]
MNKKGVQGFILLEAALVAVMAAVIWMTWAQWWAAVASSANRIDTGIEGEEQWRRLMVRLSREFHDAGEVRGGGRRVEFRDGRGKWISLWLSDRGQVLQSVNGEGDVVLANGVKRIWFVVEPGGLTVETWWARPWDQEPLVGFLASRRFLPDAGSRSGEGSGP